MKEGRYEARHYRQAEQGGVICELCPHKCHLSEGKRGICRYRSCQGNKLYTQNYGEISSFALDPIEKKPLYHFYPGKDIVSLGTVGCNFNCRFCQNWQIAQQEADTVRLAPEQAVELAVTKGGNNNLGIAYTYSEPVVWYEFVADCARLVKERGLKNVLVTNGFICEQPLKELLPFIDALNIDVKAFHTDYYTKTCGGRLEDVLATVEQAAAVTHVEVTTLLVTGLNDSEEEVGNLASWLAGISPDIPLHLSRYFPNYKLDLPPTPEERMDTAYRIAREKLNYVYLGNINTKQGRDTLCPECGAVLVVRSHSRGQLVKLRIEDGKAFCEVCGRAIPLLAEGKMAKEFTAQG